MKNIFLLLLLLTFALFSDSWKINAIVGQSAVGVTEYKSNVLKSGSFFLQENKEKPTDITKNLPICYSLEQNYPNPFNPVTTIRFSLPTEQYVKITVYNILGKEVAKIVSGKLEAGSHNVKFDGYGLTSGQYFYKLQAGNFSQIRKMILIK